MKIPLVTLNRSIELRPASWAEIQAVLHGNFHEWSCGLNKSQYNAWIGWQLKQTWARRNYQYLVYLVDDEIACSCKLYNLEFRCRGQIYRLAGIGAVFTPPAKRGNGFARAMIELLIDSRRDFDGFLLFSDIDPRFYEEAGFEELGSGEFHLWLSGLPASATLQRQDDDVFTVSDLQMESVPEMIRVYRRYLVRQPFGVERDESYWRYKLQREQFLSTHLQGGWPNLQMLTLNWSRTTGGYALFEQGGKILRVLEVIGDEQAGERLWQRLIAVAGERGVELIRGWESSLPPLPLVLRYTARQWAVPMLLSLNPALDPWLNIESCPLLELDHF